MTEENDPGEMLKPSQASVILGVDTKTIGRWAADGKIPHVRTPGGHRRYKRADVDALKHAGEQGVNSGVA